MVQDNFTNQENDVLGLARTQMMEKFSQLIDLKKKLINIEDEYLQLTRMNSEYLDEMSFINEVNETTGDENESEQGYDVGRKEWKKRLQKIQKQLKENKGSKIKAQRKLNQLRAGIEDFRLSIPQIISDDKLQKVVEWEYRIHCLQLDKMDLEDNALLYQDVLMQKDMSIKRLIKQVELRDKILENKITTKAENESTELVGLGTINEVAFVYGDTNSHPRMLPPLPRQNSWILPPPKEWSSACRKEVRRIRQLEESKRDNADNLSDHYEVHPSPPSCDTESVALTDNGKPPRAKTRLNPDEDVRPRRIHTKPEFDKSKREKKKRDTPRSSIIYDPVNKSSTSPVKRRHKSKGHRLNATEDFIVHTVEDSRDSDGEISPPSTPRTRINNDPKQIKIKSKYANRNKISSSELVASKNQIHLENLSPAQNQTDRSKKIKSKYGISNSLRKLNEQQSNRKKRNNSFRENSNDVKAKQQMKKHVSRMNRTPLSSKNQYSPNKYMKKKPKQEIEYPYVKVRKQKNESISTRKRKIIPSNRHGGRISPSVKYKSSNNNNTRESPVTKSAVKRRYGKQAQQQQVATSSNTSRNVNNNNNNISSRAKKINSIYGKRESFQRGFNSVVAGQALGNRYQAREPISRRTRR